MDLLALLVLMEPRVKLDLLEPLVLQALVGPLVTVVKLDLLDLLALLALLVLMANLVPRESLVRVVRREMRGHLDLKDPLEPLDLWAPLV